VSKIKLGLTIGLLNFAPMVVGVPIAHADFFDGARQTFQKDIPHFFQSDVPHFFQDDIPCAFGGQPTSHTKKTCKSPENSGKVPAGGTVAPPAAPNQQQTDQTPVYDQ
jgi:hypothetical protein